MNRVAQIMLARFEEAVLREFYNAENQCGNVQHPDGPWHPAAAMPHGWREELAQRWRRKRWGCGCARGPSNHVSE